MLYWLIDLSSSFPAFNVFRYITFRTGGAMVTGALFVFMFGPWIIDNLRLRQGKGQPIRTDGPQSHLMTKKGTPTMGGLMILSGLTVGTLLWANPLNPYVWIVLAVTLGFGFVGFYDDYMKVTKHVVERLAEPRRFVRRPPRVGRQIDRVAPHGDRGDPHHREFLDRVVIAGMVAIRPLRRGLGR